MRSHDDDVLGAWDLGFSLTIVQRSEFVIGSSGRTSRDLIYSEEGVMSFGQFVERSIVLGKSFTLRFIVPYPSRRRSTLLNPDPAQTLLSLHRRPAPGPVQPLAAVYSARGLHAASLLPLTAYLCCLPFPLSSSRTPSFGLASASGDHPRMAASSPPCPRSHCSHLNQWAFAQVLCGWILLELGLSRRRAGLARL